MSDLKEAIDVIQESELSDTDKGKLSRMLRLIEKSSSEMTAAELREAREYAGLSIGQAARLFGIHPWTLEWWEYNGWDFHEGRGCAGWAAKVDEVYGLGPSNAKGGDAKRPRLESLE